MRYPVLMTTEIEARIKILPSPQRRLGPSVFRCDPEKNIAGE